MRSTNFPHLFNLKETCGLMLDTFVMSVMKSNFTGCETG